MKGSRRTSPIQWGARYGAAQRAVRDVLSVAVSLDEAVPEVLPAIGEAMGWDMGEFWRVDPDAQVLRCHATWRSDQFTGRALIEEAHGLEMAPGVGLPGRAWESGQPDWVADVQKDPLFLRRPAAERNRLRGAYTFPLVVGSGPGAAPVGVLVFFTRATASYSADTLAWLAALGGEIGQFAERRRAEDALRESEEMYRLLTESSTDLIGLMTLEGRVVFVSPSVRQMLGRSPPDVIGRNAFDAIHPDDAEASKEAWARALAGEVVTLRHRARRTDGSWRWLEGWGRVVEYRGQPHVLAVSHDATELKRSQEALLLFRSLIDHTTDAIEVIDPETGRFLDVNQQACLLHGYTREELLTLSVPDLDPHVSAWSPTRIREELQRGAHRLFESDHRRKDGSVFPVEVGVNYIRLDRDYQVAVVRDITERKKAEEALRHSREQYAALIDSVDGIVWEADAQTFQFSFVSRQAERLLGHPIERWLSEPTFWRDHIHPDDRDEAVRFCVNAAGEGRDHEFEYRMLAADGRAVWLRDIVSVIVQDGQPVSLRGLMVDITDARAAEEALRTSEERFRAAVTSMSEGLVVADADDVIQFANGAFCRMLGRSRIEVEGHTAAEFAASPDDAALIRSKLALRGTGMSDRYEVHFRRSDGVVVQATVSGAPFLNAAGQVVGSTAVIADVTEQRELEARLRQSQKMEAVGRLAGGVAHDFNNILTAIINYADLLLTSPDAATDWRADVEEIRAAGQRAAILTKQLLSFSRRQVVHPRVLDVNRTIRGVQQMLQRVIGEDIELVADLDPDAGCIRADPGQVEQVLVNLAVNARDAMPEGGRIRVRTEAVVLDRDVTEEGTAVPAGAYVLVSVSDTGVGMDEETRARIFEPFFTTKSVGKGTGLGLATVYGIVSQAEGYLRVDSAPGQGTTFRVHLPRVEEAPDDDPTSTRATPPRTGGTILLVEDDASVRRVTAEVLTRHGYSVVTSDGPEAALAELERRQGEIDLMVTDLVMPGLSGRELADRVGRLWPRVKVLFISGYPGETIARRGVVPTDVAYLSKPFTIDEILERVSELLEGT